MRTEDDYFIITIEHHMGDDVEIVTSPSSGPCITEVAEAVRRCLLGATFHPDTVDRYLKVSWSLDPEDHVRETQGDEDDWREWGQ